MNQTEGILSFSINLPEMKIGIGFFFYLRNESRGGGVIYVIVSSIDNSNLPVVCRYCRLIIFFFTNVETFWYIQVCLEPDSAKIVHILQALPVWFLLTQNCMFSSFLWRHRYWKILAVMNQISKIQIKDSKKITKIL